MVHRHPETAKFQMFDRLRHVSDQCMASSIKSNTGTACPDNLKYRGRTAAKRVWQVRPQGRCLIVLQVSTLSPYRLHKFSISLW